MRPRPARQPAVAPIRYGIRLPVGSGSVPDAELADPGGASAFGEGVAGVAPRPPGAADWQGILRRAEFALDAGRPALAASRAREAIRLAPEDGVDHYTLGRALAGLHRHGEALEAAREACRLRPDDSRLAWLVPACLLDLGRVREAARESAALVASAPE